MKKFIYFSIITMSLFNFCLAHGLELSDVIKQARDEAKIEKIETKTNVTNKATSACSDSTKESIKNNVSSTLNEVKNTNQ